MIVSPRNATFDFSSQLKTHCTNNQAKYKALLFDLELLGYMGVTHVKILGDSQLVVQQILGEYQCLDDMLNDYLKRCWDIMRSFDEFGIRHISRAENSRANSLVQEASGYRITRGEIHISKNPINKDALISEVTDRPTTSYGPSAIVPDRTTLSSELFDANKDITLINSVNDIADTVDCRTPLIMYLSNPSVKTNRGVRWTTFKYVLIDNELYR
jgi:ribonuclease HI